MVNSDLKLSREKHGKIPDRFCADTKTIPDRTSVHTYEWWFWRDFCNVAKLRRADLKSGASHIGLAFCVAEADAGFFLGGGELVSCSISTPINHIVFFLQNTSCIRKPQVISGGGGGVRTPCTLPLDPPLGIVWTWPQIEEVMRFPHVRGFCYEKKQKSIPQFYLIKLLKIVGTLLQTFSVCFVEVATYF